MCSGQGKEGKILFIHCLYKNQIFLIYYDTLELSTCQVHGFKFHAIFKYPCSATAFDAVSVSVRYERHELGLIIIYQFIGGELSLLCACLYVKIYLI